MKRKEKQPPVVLLTREQSTMVSSWTEALCLSRVRAGQWQIGRYTYQIYNIRDVVIPPEDASEEELEEWDPFNADLPDEYDGHALLGVVDGEYVQTDELILRDDSVVFGKKNIDVARAYATVNGWSDEPEFQAAWLVLLNEVAPSVPTSIRATVDIFGAGPGMGGTSFVHFKRTGSRFRVFVGGTSSDELIEIGTVLASAGWRGRLKFLLENFDQCEDCRVEDVRIAGARGLEAQMIALVWAGPNGARFARVLQNLQDEELERLAASGDLTNHDCVAEFERLESICVDSERMMAAIRKVLAMASFEWKAVIRIARRAEKVERARLMAEEERRTALAPFASAIEHLVHSWWSFVGGATGTGDHWRMTAQRGALERFLQNHVFANGAFPVGRHVLVFKFFNSEQSFEVDVDGLRAYADGQDGLPNAGAPSRTGSA